MYVCMFIYIYIYIHIVFSFSSVKSRLPIFLRTYFVFFVFPSEYQVGSESTIFLPKYKFEPSKIIHFNLIVTAHSCLMYHAGLVTHIIIKKKDTRSKIQCTILANLIATPKWCFKIKFFSSSPIIWRNNTSWNGFKYLPKLLWSKRYHLSILSIFGCWD